MAMLSRICNGCLIVHSVGDHEIEDGFAQMQEAMAKAEAEYQRSGVKIPMYLDMLESEEARDHEEIWQIGNFFRRHLSFLDGRIAVLVKRDLHFGLSRIFAAMTEADGLDVRPFYKQDEALAFIGLNSEDLNRTEDSA